jgi:hypothetical protein
LSGGVRFQGSIRGFKASRLNRSAGQSSVGKALPGGNWKPIEGCGFQRWDEAASSGAAEETGQERDHEERQEHEKQYLRDSCRRSGYAAKAERAGDDGNDKKN